MYTVKGLAEMYETSRPTIYKKLNHENLKPFIVKDENTIKLKKEGLNALNLIMAESKVVENKVESKVDNQLKADDNTYLQYYINSLQNQIDDLKKEKRELIERHEKEKLDIRNMYESTIETLKFTTKLLKSPEKKDENVEKKSFWSIFKKQ